MLQPHTRIPAHTGIANFRLVVHLPLIVPPDCGFRVGAETRQWRIGEAWVFDDTIEHEAWNDSDQTRIIFICDVWSPRLSQEERAAHFGDVPVEGLEHFARRALGRPWRTSLRQIVEIVPEDRGTPVR